MKKYFIYGLSLLFLLNTASFAGKRIERDETQFDENVTMKRDLTVADAIDNSAGKIIANQIENKDISSPIIVQPNNGVLTGDFDLMTFKSGGNKHNLVGLNKIRTDNIQATDGETQITISNNIIVYGTSEFNGNMDLQNSTIADVGFLGAVEGDFSGSLNVDGVIRNDVADLTLQDDVIVTGTLDAQGAIQNTTGNLIIDGTTDFNNNNVLNIATINMGAGGDILFPSGGNVGSVGNRVSNIYVTTLDATTIAGTPTFSGTPSFGNITVTGTSDLQGDISNTTASPVTFNDTQGVLVNNGILDVRVDIEDTIDNTVTIDDAVIITGASDLRGDIQNTDGLKPVTFNDVHGVLVSSGVLDVRVDIEDTGDNIVRIDDNLVVTGTSDLRLDINNTTGAVVVDDAQGLVVDQGVLDVHGTIQNTDGTSPVTFNDAQGVLVSTGVLDVRVDIEDTADNIVTIDDAVVVTGTLDAQGAIQNTTVSGKVTISDVDGINLSTVPAHADDATAGVAGLVTGDVYQTDGTGAAPLNVAGILMIKQ